MSAAITFIDRADAAVKNAQLQRTLNAATSKYVRERIHALGRLGDSADALRDRAKEIRAATLEHLDEHLARLAANIEQNGGVVHWARDAEEARGIIVQLARERNVKLVTKSKSMVGEEIELNHALEAAGITPVETDLGEYIVQLAHERPSHIIAPVFHMTKEQVADLFTREFGRKVEPDIRSMVALARSELREKFLRAEMGFTGVNFAIAETGTLAIVTNEGNGRMCSNAPRIHVALMSIEKVVPTWDEFAVLLGVLPRSATGQQITVYTTMTTGPKRPNDPDGPEELHVVILDNGRSKLLAGEMREALQCIRCGACLNICPVYSHLGGHAYGWVYPGPIGSLLTPSYAGLREYADLPHASSLCGACRDVCPVRIDIPRMLVSLRTQEVKQNERPFIENAIFRLTAFVLKRPFLFSLASKLGRWAQLPFRRGERLPSLPLMGRWTRSRDFPMIQSKTFHARWKELERQ
jgi:L-lactate dehydrogenase complex protein LldF